MTISVKEFRVKLKKGSSNPNKNGLVWDDILRYEHVRYLTL